MRVELGAQFALFGVVKREGDWYIAHCPPLDVTTQGRTESEAKANLVEASALFLISCLERGTLDQALKELGFIPVKGDLRATRREVKGNVFRMDVPIPFRFGSK